MAGTETEKTGKKRALSRRGLLKGIAAGATGLTVVPSHVLGGSGGKAPSYTLDVGLIGAGGRGVADGMSVGRRENLVALCDVDRKEAKRMRKRFPKAQFFSDYRRMLEKISDSLDAVIVATPDHSHFHATLSAMQLGLPVYCEKPLAHTVSQVRRLTEAAEKYDVVTQMGNQGHSSWSTARMRDWILDGAIGEVREVLVWKRGTYGARRPAGKDPVPDSLDYDLWLNREPRRPYDDTFHPGGWRRWSFFGTGCVGDWGCHQLDAAYYSLDLHAPERVTVDTGPWPVKSSFPLTQTLTWHFPARGDRPPVRIRWILLEDRTVAEAVPRPRHVPEDVKLHPDRGTAIIGEKATILHGGHGEGGQIVPEEKMNEAGKPPQQSPRVGGHHESWLKAIKGESQALSSFDYAGPLAETVLLGNVALRSKEKDIRWDRDKMKVLNDADANALIHDTDPREGWDI